MSKFINYEIDLPEADSDRYIISTMKFRTKQDHDYYSKSYVAEIFRTIDLPIRERLILIQRLNLIMNPNLFYEYYYPVISCFLLLVKHIDHKLFNKYFIKDKFSRTGEKKLSETSYMEFLKVGQN